MPSLSKWSMATFAEKTHVSPQTQSIRDLDDPLIKLVSSDVTIAV
jgi:hypothetical protein